MLVIDSSRGKAALSAAWLAFAGVNAWLTYFLAGEETIPYHLIWASYALLYGLYSWSRTVTWASFLTITGVTGYALVRHAQSGVIGWEECSEIPLMGVLVALLIWHVNRQRVAQTRLADLRELERGRAEQREVTARFGTHEVRTRLTIARGFAEMIRDNATDDTNRSDAMVVLTELDKAAATTSNLLTLVRVEAPSVRISVNVADLIAAILARWKATADRQWSSEVHVRVILGEPERLESILDCLLENAVKFTAPGDAISVTVSTDGPDVLIAVRDTGLGIPEGDLPGVTEPFTTGSAAGDRAGSGLGLAIVRMIVESRGGSLSLASVEGAGTTATIRMCGAFPERVAESAETSAPGRVDVAPGRHAGQSSA
ncbi:MAG: two-component system, OmpR family, sensor kinase [Pseudonocardiales bacterium]|nr:two-component system, OmpR family, sensor kinase [Pseudonocardiales bacterium]